MQSLEQKIALCRSLCLAGCIGIIVILVTRDNSWIAKAIFCFPFLLVLPGIATQRYRSYSWLTLMILLYFILAVTDAMAPNGNWLGWLFVSLTVIVFLSATFGSRWLQRFHIEAAQSEMSSKQEQSVNSSTESITDKPITNN